ncbi:MAG: LytS/YhcK type 5TM receptor domain-containing protein, partial [Bacteroidota bacterium]
MAITFIQNAALLVTLSVFYGLITWYRPKEKIYFQALTGFWFGIVSIAAMMMPFEYMPGAIYDGRSVILTLAGLFGGGVTTLVSVIIAGAFRAYLGGAGIWAGLVTIALCGVTGLFFRRIFRNKLNKLSLLVLLLIGIVSHVVMLASQLLLPGQTAFQVISRIWLPVMLVFPLTFTIISKLFQIINLHIRNEKDLRVAEELYRTTLFSIGDAVIVTSISGEIIRMNTIAEKLTGWTLNEAKGKNLPEVFKIINEDTRRVVEDPVDKVLEKGQIVGLANHTLLISKDEKEIPIADSAAPIKNEQGKLTGVVLVFRDQSEERRYQNELARSEAQYRELVE